MSLGNVGAATAPISWLQEGWATLREYAHNALTHFKGEDDGGEPHSSGVSRWGIVAVDLIDAEEAFEARFEVPGLAKEDLEVEIIADRLIVRGTKRMDQRRREAGCLITERAFGSFQRAISVPSGVRTDGVKAQYTDGVLSVTLPKASKSRPDKVLVK